MLLIRRVPSRRVDGMVFGRRIENTRARESIQQYPCFPLVMAPSFSFFQEASIMRSIILVPVSVFSCGSLTINSCFLRFATITNKMILVPSAIPCNRARQVTKRQVLKFVSTCIWPVCVCGYILTDSCLWTARSKLRLSGYMKQNE